MRRAAVKLVFRRKFVTVARYLGRMLGQQRAVAGFRNDSKDSDNPLSGMVDLHQPCTLRVQLISVEDVPSPLVDTKDIADLYV